MLSCRPGLLKGLLVNNKRDVILGSLLSAVTTNSGVYRRNTQPTNCDFIVCSLHAFRLSFMVNVHVLFRFNSRWSFFNVHEEERLRFACRLQNRIHCKTSEDKENYSTDFCMSKSALTRTKNIWSKIGYELLGHRGYQV